VGSNLPLVILLFQTLHIFSNMSAKNIFLQNLRVQLLRFWVIAREALLVVGNVETTVAGTFESSKNARSGRSAFQANVEIALEGTRRIFTIESFGQRNGAIRLCDALVLVGKAQLG
jgi:hypothetical protein